jgi:DNA-binding NarL/FixJ family response regulator
MRTHSLLLAIYDENTLTKQLLHNKIEQYGFKVLFSCTEKEKLYNNLKAASQPGLLMMCADNDWKKTLKVMRQVKFLYSGIDTLIYLCKESNTIASEFVKAGAKFVVASCSFEKLIEKLDSLLPQTSISGKNNSHILNPYEALIKNMKNIIVLRGMAEGKTNKEIGKMADLAESSVKTYKKRIMGDLDSHSASEAVAKAKDFHLI